MPKIVGSIDRNEANFLKGEIESGVNARAKRALQILCRLFRLRYGFLPGDKVKIENAIIGALSSGRSDEKVRRWSLSALSHFGTERACWSAVENVIRGFPDEPQVISAGIAALYKMNRSRAASFLISVDSVSSELLTLSAHQSLGPSDSELPALTLDVAKSDPTSLKLGLVLVGLEKSPEFLFDKKHSNKVMVKELGGHHDPLISQYSVWAVAENKFMSVADLGIDLYDIGSRPENVRHYVYRLFAAENTYSRETFGIVEEGSVDESDEARLGAAMGLRDTYYEGIQDLTIDWLFREENDEVRSYVVDHMVRHAAKQPLYDRYARELFASSGSDGAMRERMIASAAGAPIGREFRRILHQEDEGLFGKKETVNMTTNNHIGAVNMHGTSSISGDAINNGQQLNVTTHNVNNQIIEKLIEAKSQIGLLDLDANLKKEALDAVTEAEKEPTPTKVQAAIGAIRKVAAVIGEVTTFGAGLMTIAQGISALI